jgi:probable addiction module antidote protein
MSEKPVIGPLSSRREIADHINRAFKTTDVIAISQAIGDAVKLHNIPDVAKMAGIERTSVYRAFRGTQAPNLTTTMSVLDAMGFQLRVTQRRGRPSLPRLEPAARAGRFR